MRYCFILIAFVSLLCSCKKGVVKEDTDVLARVKKFSLSRTDIVKQIPESVSHADSLLIAENLVKKWIKDALIYDVASRNLGKEEKDEIERQVEEYRHSLVSYRYQEKLVHEKLAAKLSSEDKINYYKLNQMKFALDKALIKGLFLKIPKDAPALLNVKQWYKSTSESALEKIEKYSLQNAVTYDYFCDKWTDFDQVMENIPVHVKNVNDFLKINHFLEISDSSFCYLLNIKEYLPVGSIAPYNYVEPHIVEILTNQRRIEFLKKFEDELYNDAVKKGDVEFLGKSD